MTEATPSGAQGGRTLRFLAGQPVSVLESVSAKKAEALRRWGVETILDLVTTYPYRYIDRTRRLDVAELVAGGPGALEAGRGAEAGRAAEAVVLARVQRVDVRRAGGGRGGRARVELEVADHSGSMRVVFFNQPWRAEQLRVGTEALFSGSPTEFRGRRQMVNPVVDVLVESEAGSEGSTARTLRVVPVYPQSAKSGLTSAELGRWVAEALERSGRFADPLPEEWRRRLELVSRTEALRRIHLPESVGDELAARRRLAFDELFRLQLALVLRRRAMEWEASAIRHEASVLDVTTPCAGSPGSGDDPHRGPGRGAEASLLRRFLCSLPFELTEAQRRALAAIVAELAGPRPMHRLLQGDVGSGKTVVAVAALLVAVQGNRQGALMAPTEVLAEQHFMAVRALVGALTVEDPARLGGSRPVHVALLTNRTPAAERTRLRQELEAGTVDLVVGTHALLTDDIVFRSLGVAVIDEQHRFGVEQRAALREKGRSSVAAGLSGADPDLLVMTATPIPRTAAMILFGDLDMVVLDELPPGRTPVTTVWARTPLEEIAAWSKVREQVAAGNRAYVVCPLVEGSERVQARSATEELARLAEQELHGLRLGLLHGQMAAPDKEATMAAFRRGDVQVLVATTVVEVGVDVAEATVMVVEDAERFGISQLHQLRGRVGRSDRPSWCYLLGDTSSEAGRRRLEAVERTSDGFELAEVDLDQRGEGTILGARQNGRSDLKLAKLRKDADLLRTAREVAEEMVDRDGSLARMPLLQDEVRLFLDPEEEEFLFKS
ncbi:MAG: ATP-dependent DNA helicase RecG [Actinomycetota bacterium]|nr:ATP-dependent DNA helicase RecG [Actinomycetota bacterium]